MDIPVVRKGQGSVKLTHEEFARRLSERFADPAFDGLRLQEVRNVAKTVVEAVRLQRSGNLPRPDRGVSDPRPK